MKKFSSYGVDDGFVAKIHMCVHILSSLDNAAILPHEAPSHD